MTSTREKAEKAIVAFAIEKALLEFGAPALEEVTNMLLEHYHCEISDCFEKPQYLNKVLKDIFGNSYIIIVKSIKKNLEEFAYEKPIENFLNEISKS